MVNEQEDFIDALESFINAELLRNAESAEYNSEAVAVIDARNHLFRLVGRRGTDEEAGIYAIRELCRIDEDTLETRLDRGRLAAVAREAGLHD